MKIRGRADNPETQTREETRELAEALSLFGSAMRHAADRRAARMPIASPADTARRLYSRMRLALAPALAVAAAIAVAIPMYGHFHEETAAARTKPPVVQQQENNTEARASVSDTVLMNQIDNDLSQDVPDALQPLAQLGEQAAANSNSTEKKNATQE